MTSTMEIEGKAWALTEVPISVNMPQSIVSLGKQMEPVSANELATQVFKLEFTVPC